MKNLILFLISVLLLTACEDSDKTINQLTKGITEIKEQIATGKIEDTANEEIDKLHTFEYKVLEFSLITSSLEIEQKLAQLGQDRWECFSVEVIQTSIKVFCKRKPKTYLRYLMRN
jgi:hypothetical protein